MARLRIIILDRIDADTYRYALWADVPLARQAVYANVEAKSVWKDATTADNTALQSGAVVETTSSQRVPAGSTLPQIEAFLESRWANFQAEITNNNPWQRYGSTWDGTTWVVLNNG